jgi:glucuronide carrier protein
MLREAPLTSPLRWPHILGYGAGDFANNLVFSLGAIFLLNYYTDIAGFSAAAAGSLIFSTRILSAMTDLIAGRTVDRIQTRTARFRPFLLWGAIPLMLANLAVFSIPQGWGEQARLAYAAISCGLLVTAYSFVNIPYGALASVMTQVPHERTILGVSRTAMSLMAGLALAIFLRPFMNEAADKHAAIMEMMLLVSVIGFACYVACFKLTRENVIHPTARASTRHSIQSVLKNTPLIVLCATAFLTLVGAFAMSTSVIYFVRYILNDPSQLVVIIALATIPGTLVSSLSTPLLVRRIGKKAVCMAGLGLASASYFGLFLIAPSDLPYLYAAFALAGYGQMAAGMTIWALAADTVEYGEWRSGVRIEGLTYSVFSCTRKAGQALGGALPALLLSFTGYVANEPVQGEAARFGIWAALSLIPAIAFLIAGLAMLRYPLSDRRFEQLVKEIQARRQM